MTRGQADAGRACDLAWRDPRRADGARCASMGGRAKADRATVHGRGWSDVIGCPRCAVVVALGVRGLILPKPTFGGVRHPGPNDRVITAFHPAWSTVGGILTTMSAGTGSVAPVVAGPETLLRTKLFLPRGRSSLVARARLHELLGSGAMARLTLVDAPAGWGKTTLLTDWLVTGEAPRSCWVSLDGADNDPLRFWSYLLAALRTVVPELGEAALPLLRSSATDIERDLVPVLVNDVAAFDAELLLVLDDYHVITNAEIHRCVGVLIERLPATLRLVISTRSDPPLPLARLRVRGELLELRADDLRFTPEESDLLFNDLLHLNLGAEDVGRLQSRTEGWAAGLQLAALTLRDRPDAMAFIARFAGDDRHVVDYLGAEVLDALDPATLTFLLHTSVLNRLCGPLCDAVTRAHRLLPAAGRGGADEPVRRPARPRPRVVPLPPAVPGAAAPRTAPPPPRRGAGPAPAGGPLV